MTSPADVVDADFDAASVLKMMNERGTVTCRSPKTVH